MQPYPPSTTLTHYTEHSGVYCRSNLCVYSIKYCNYYAHVLRYYSTSKVSLNIAANEINKST